LVLGSSCPVSKGRYSAKNAKITIYGNVSGYKSSKFVTTFNTLPK
jgi:hypothetical protein